MSMPLGRHSGASNAAGAAPVAESSAANTTSTRILAATAKGG